MKNSFAEKENAENWIKAIEAMDSNANHNRPREVYPFLRKWVEKVNPNVVVDIGAGQGTCADKLGAFNGRYIGVEPSDPLRERAEELYGGKPNVAFCAGSAEDIPLEDNIADAVFSVCVWFHVENLDKAGQELARVLKPNGHFLIITADPDSYDLWRKFHTEADIVGNKLTGTIELQGHTIYNTIYMYSEDELVNSLTQSGLHVTKNEKMGKGESHQDDLDIFIALEGYKK